MTIDATTAPTGLAITPGNYTIGLGGSVSYAATASYPTYGQFNVATLATWASNPTNVTSGPTTPASLNELVTHHGTATGPFTISAVYRNQTATATLQLNGTRTVSTIAITSIVVGSGSDSYDNTKGVPVGLPMTFGVDVVYSDGQHDPSSFPSGVTFTSSPAGGLSAFTGNVTSAITTIPQGSPVTVTAHLGTAPPGTITVWANTDTLSAISFPGATAGPTITLPKNTTEGLTVDGTYNSQTFDISSLVSSSSTNSAAVSVSTTSSGTTVTSHTASTTLTFLKDGVSRPLTATVSGGCITGIAVTPSTVATLPVGVTQHFVATATYSDGSAPQVVTTDSDILWTTGGAYLTGNGNVTGIFTANTAGSATVVATLTDPSRVCAGGNIGQSVVTANATATVTAAVITGLNVTFAPFLATRIPLHESGQLHVTATFSDSRITQADVTSSCTFAAQDPAVVSVSTGGLVSALTAGATNVIVSYPLANLAATDFPVTVADCGVPSVTISNSHFNNNDHIAVGQSTTYTATATYNLLACAPANSQSTSVTSAATWNSTNQGAATIVSGGSNAGKLTAIGSGTTTVTAVYKTQTSNALNIIGDATITLTGLTVGAPAPLPIGSHSTPLTVGAVWNSNVGYQGYPLPVLSWNISDPTIVSIDSSNVVHALAVGSTTISAQSGLIASTPVTVTVSPLCVASVSVGSTLGSPSNAYPVGVPFTAVPTCTMSDGTTPPCTPTYSYGTGIDQATLPTGQGIILAGGADNQVYIKATIAATSSCTGSDLDSPQLVFIRGNATLQSISLTPINQNIPVNTSQAYTSQGTYTGSSGAGPFDLTAVATLHSNNASVVLDPGFTSHDMATPSTVTATSTVGTAGITSSYLGVTSNLATLTTSASTVLTGITILADKNLTPAGGAGTAKYPANGFQLQLHAWAHYNDATPSNEITSQVTWSLATPVVSGTTISTGGLLTTGSAAGPQNVLASLNGVTSLTPLAVTFDTASITSARITDSSGTPLTTASVPNGAAGLYEVQAVTAGGTYWVTRNFTWASSNTTVATIVATGANAGQLQAVAASGTTNVTASQNELTVGPLVVTATSAIPSSITCAPGTVTVRLGSTAQLRAFVTFSDHSVAEETTSALTTWPLAASPTGTVSFAGNHDGIVTATGVGSVTVLPTYTPTGISPPPAVVATAAQGCVVTIQ